VSAKVTADNGTVTGGAAWIISGTVSARNADELNLMTAQQQAGTSSFGILFGGRPATFASTRPGDYTVCAAVLPAALNPMQGMQYFQNHAADLPVTCKAMRVLAQPAEQSIDIQTTLPALVPDP
jgi:hypothetical protein